MSDAGGGAYDEGERSVPRHPASDGAEHEKAVAFMRSSRIKRTRVRGAKQSLRRAGPLPFRPDWAIMSWHDRPLEVR
jgi:hypothetical protein